MTNVTEICQPGFIYTLDEANEILPVVIRITEKHQNKVEKLLEQQRYFVKSGAKPDKIKSIDDAVGKELVTWGSKLLKLGCTCLPHGFVGFDFGSGFWSWHYGEDKVEYYHGYNDPPHSRRKINFQTGPVL